jgi:hypothetical protein
MLFKANFQEYINEEAFHLTLKGCTYYRYLSILHMNVYLVTYGCVTNIGVKIFKYNCSS